MRGSVRYSSSLTANKENSPNSGILNRTRRRLQESFDDTQCKAAPIEGRNEEKTWNTSMLSSVSVPRIHPARVLRSGANTLSRTLSCVQTTFGTLSQKFRRSTKRHHQFKNERSCSPITPQTRSRHILGRTPTKLYSPFGIETPHKNSKGKTNTHEKGRGNQNHRADLKKVMELSKSNGKPTKVTANEIMIAEQRNFDPDMEEVRISIWELRQTAHNIVKRSLPH